MKTDVRLSTRFLTTQNAHQVGMLVSLEGETPVRRAPINVSLVLDRSGSMEGPPLEAAKAAAARFASFLTLEDRLSVVPTRWPASSRARSRDSSPWRPRTSRSRCGSPIPASRG